MKKLLLIITFSLTSLISCEQQVTEENATGRTISSQQELITTCDYSAVSISLRTPTTINQTVDLINALPKPLSIPCFIESLTRPLKLNITLSKSSAQPAVGTTSPRIFIISDDLVLSIVPEGKGAYFLELSQMYSDSSSVKSELEFPVREAITYQTGYDRINLGGATACGPCHLNEQPDNSIAESNAFTSFALKPKSNMDLVDFKSELYKCELETSLSYRCQMIKSIFKFEQVSEVDFPSGTPRWIDTIN
jgi:hypothetical protein